MVDEGGLPPKYDPELVAREMLIEAIEHHPVRLTVDELTRQIVADPGDPAAMGTLADAVDELQGAGLIRCRGEDRVVEPTHAARRAYAILMPDDPDHQASS